ncbi:MAG: FkbM family methyltransferase [Bryobacterales bacterium]|nr:FkbM family methyltransferase [Bryobacterales bacterium]
MPCRLQGNVPWLGIHGNRALREQSPREPDPDDGSVIYVVMCTSIDEYAARKNLSGHYVIKIDTQGGEVEVFEGMNHLRQTRQVTCISEFVPEAIATRVCPIEWLTRVSEGCSIFEVPGMDMFLSPSHSLRYVPRDTVPEFVNEIRERPNRYTDIVLIPETLPGHTVLARRLGKPS